MERSESHLSKKERIKKVIYVKKFDRYKLAIKDEQDLESFLTKRSLAKSDVAILLAGSIATSFFEPVDYFSDRERVITSYLLARPLEYIDKPLLSSIHIYRDLSLDNLVEVVEIQTPHSNKSVINGFTRANEALKSLGGPDGKPLTNLISIISELIGPRSYTLQYRTMGATSLAYSKVVGSEIKRRADKNIILAQYNVLTEVDLSKDEIEYRYKIFMDMLKGLNPGTDLLFLVNFPYLSRISGGVEANQDSFDDKLKSLGSFLQRLITKRFENSKKGVPIKWFSEFETIFELRKPIVIPSEVFVSKNLHELAVLANLENLKKIVNIEERLVVIGYDGPQRLNELHLLTENISKEKTAITRIPAYGTYSTSEKECIVGIVLTIDEAVEYISLEARIEKSQANTK